MGNSDSHQRDTKNEQYSLPEMNTTTTTKPLPIFIESFDNNNAMNTHNRISLQRTPSGSTISTCTISTVSNISTFSTQNSSIYQYTDVSKLLYYMDTNTLASLTKYMLENESYFSRYKHHSLNVYHALINYRIKGKMLIKFDNEEFCDELPWIPVAIKSLLYDRLRSLNEDEITNYLSKISEMNINEEIPSKIIKLPAYLPQIDITSAQHAQDRNIKYPLSMCTAHELQVFVYILCTCTAYKPHDIKSLLEVLILLNLTGKQFMQLKRHQFYHKLKPYNIKGGIASKLYKLLLPHSHDIYAYIRKQNVSLILTENSEKPD